MPKEMSYYRRYLQRLKEEWGIGFPVSDEVLDDLAEAAEECRRIEALILTLMEVA